MVKARQQTSPCVLTLGMEHNEGTWPGTASGSYIRGGGGLLDHSENRLYPNSDAPVINTTYSYQTVSPRTSDTGDLPLEGPSLGPNNYANGGLVRQPYSFGSHSGRAIQGEQPRITYGLIRAHAAQLPPDMEAAATTEEPFLAVMGPESSMTSTGNVNCEPETANIPFEDLLNAHREPGEPNWLTDFPDPNCPGYITVEDPHQSLLERDFSLLGDCRAPEIELSQNKPPIVVAWDPAGRMRPHEDLVDRDSSTTYPGPLCVATDQICYL